MLIEILVVILIGFLMWILMDYIEKRRSIIKLKYMPAGDGHVFYPPKRAYEYDAGYDLTATSMQIDYDNQAIEYGTNLKVEIPKGHVGLLFPRSSIYKKNLQLSNSVGVIDSGYRGEVKFKYRSTRTLKGKSPSSIERSPKYYTTGDRVGQLVIVEIGKSKMKRASQLSPSKRGTKGYGSSGTK